MTIASNSITVACLTVPPRTGTTGCGQTQPRSEADAQKR